MAASVAVTGATGFVGSHLLDALLEPGAAVACLARGSAHAVPLETRGCRVVMGDLASARACASLVAGAEIVFHVAGLVAARRPEDFMAVNRDGTRRLLAAAREAGVRRFVHVSSLAVTGPTERGMPLDESGPPRPVTPYGRSKRAGEDAVRESGVAFTIVRPPVVYGPRDRELLRVFRVARLGWAPLLGDGRQELSLVHAADLARALVAAAFAPEAEGRTYHAAHPQPVTQRALVESVGRSLGRLVRLVPLPPAVVRAGLHVSGAIARIAGVTTMLSPEKAAELLAPAWTCTSAALERDAGWRADVALDDGLAGTAAWYRQARWLRP